MEDTGPDLSPVPPPPPKENGSARPSYREIRQSVRYPLLFVLALWLVEGLYQATGNRQVHFGIVPRTFEGLIGIFTSPFIHGGIDHLTSNTLPLLVVGSGMIYFYKEITFRVIGMIWLFTGFWVWLAARPDPHIGASGLIYGMVVFLFFSGIFRRDTRLMAISMLVVFLYGSLAWGILPLDWHVSWESHLAGSIAGLFASIYYRKDGPQRPKAQWEIDEALEGSSMQSDDSKKTDTTYTPTQPSQDIKVNFEYKERDKPSQNENQSN